MRKGKLEVGDFVLLRDSALGSTFGRKLADRYTGPYVIAEKRSGNTYVLADLDGSLFDTAVHGNRLVLFRKREETASEEEPVFDEEVEEPTTHSEADSTLISTRILDQVYVGIGKRLSSLAKCRELRARHVAEWSDQRGVGGRWQGSSETGCV
jgi:hypothetical protein